MSEGSGTNDRAEGGFLRGAILILVVGTLCGLLYNFAGLRAESGWGVAWIGEDKLAGLDTLEETAEDANGSAGDAGSAYDDYSVDPMGFAAAPASNVASDVPQIPDLGRPIQIQLSAVKKFHDADAALFVDAREDYEFAEGHIAGAVNLPGEQAVTDPALLETIDSGGRPIITYCGGGACELSLSLAYSLMDVGHSKLLVFMGGYPEWAEAGYPISGSGAESGEAAEETADASSGFGAGKAGLWAAMAVLAGIAFWSRNGLVVRACQILIGGVFLWAGMAKVGDLSQFVSDIHNYRVLPIALENVAAMTMPWIEVFAGLALIVGIERRGGALLATAMMVVFTLAVGQAIARDISISCGCFGKAGAATTGTIKLVENLLMTATAAGALLRPRR